MTALVLLTLIAVPSDAELRRVLHQRFEAAGRQTPPADAQLDRAAHRLARAALGSNVHDATGLLRVTAAVSETGGWDPDPVVVLVRASADDLLPSMATQLTFGEPFSAVGLAVEMGSAERGTAVVLLARRRMELSPFARTHKRPPNQPQRLCGLLLPPLTSAEVFVTRPQGQVDAFPMEATADQRACALITFPTIGRHTVEVLGHGPQGPEVAALLFVDVGHVANADEAAQREPSTFEAARAVLLVRINALRLRMGLAAVTPQATLDEVAQRWADRLASEGFFAHVAPDGSDLKSRLAAAKVAFAAAGENLGASSGPLAAHFGIEHSPGHRKNLLEPGHRHLGIGLAGRADGLTVLVEVLATPLETQPATNPLKEAYEALNRERARRHLKPLEPNPVLESLAQAHARAALEAQVPKAEIPGKPKLHERAFALLDDAQAIAVDFVVADAPQLIVDSKNVASPKYSWVGVGLTQGDSPTYGDHRYWITVIYAERR